MVFKSHKMSLILFVRIWSRGRSGNRKLRVWTFDVWMCRFGVGGRSSCGLCGPVELESWKVLEFWSRGSVDVQELGGCGRGRLNAWMCGHVGLWRGELRNCGFVQS